MSSCLCLAHGKRRVEQETIKEENRAKITESKIGMLELHGDDESHISINYHALGVDDVESSSRGKVNEGLDINTDQQLFPRIQSTDIDTGDQQPATSVEPVATTAAPAIIKCRI